MDTFFIFGAKYLFILPVLISIWLYFKNTLQDRRNILLFTFSSLGLTLSIGKVANQLFENPRPFVVNDFLPLVNHAADNGFPSDHALLVGGLAALVTAYNRKFGLIMWVIAIIVGYSRVYVGVHHPVDIMASFLIAGVSSTALYLVFRKRRMI